MVPAEPNPLLPLPDSRVMVNGEALDAWRQSACHCHALDSLRACRRLFQSRAQDGFRIVEKRTLYFLPLGDDS